MKRQTLRILVILALLMGVAACARSRGRFGSIIVQKLYVEDGGVDMLGNKIDLDDDNDTSITVDTDDQIDIEIAGADDFRFTANTFTALAGSTMSFPATSDLSVLGYVNIGDGTPDGAVTAGNDEELYVEGELEVDGEAEFDGAVDADGGVNAALEQENVGALPTILSTSVITTTSGAVWTIADGEIWFIHNVYCNVTTNFDCTGDDCTLDVGDGNDADGLLDLDDAELQTADTDVANGTAGWQGYGADTIGAFMAAGAGFIYAPSGSAETIDIAVGEDTGDTISAGAATCYLVYTRLQ